MLWKTLTQTVLGVSTAVAAMSLATSAAEPLIQHEKVLSPAEIKSAARNSSFTDSGLAILGSSSSFTRVEGFSFRPPLTLNERMSLGATQLASDAGQAAASTFNEITGTANVTDNGLGTQTVFNGESRSRVTNTTGTPYRAVCQIQTTWAKGTGTTATAEFVAPRLLLTNAHCSYLKDRGGWAKSIKIIPGKNGSSEPYGSQYAMTWYVPNAWVNGNNTATSVDPNCDICWLILPDKTLFNKVGYAFGYMTVSDSTLASSKLNMAGYPNNPKNSTMNGSTMWYEYSGGNQNVSANSFRHYLDTNPGASGSPMWLYYTSGQYAGGRYVVGVNDAESSSSNYATRMTSSYFNSTKGFATQYP